MIRMDALAPACAGAASQRHLGYVILRRNFASRQEAAARGVVRIVRSVAAFAPFGKPSVGLLTGNVGSMSGFLEEPDIGFATIKLPCWSARLLNLVESHSYKINYTTTPDFGGLARKGRKRLIPLVGAGRFERPTPLRPRQVSAHPENAFFQILKFL
jgi:hypothetical protein